MRFGSSAVPLHLVPLHRQQHTLFTFCPSRLFHVPLSLLRAHVLRIIPFPGRMGVLPFRAGSLSGGVCVEPWHHSKLLGFEQGVQAAHPVLHQRKHWVCAGDVGGDAHRCTCLF